MTSKEGYTSLQLTFALKFHQCTAPYFGAVIAADKIPPPISVPTFVIINTSTDPAIVGHWVLIYFANQKSPAIYFDSLGQLPEMHSAHIKNYLQLHSSPYYVMNWHRFQPPSSSLCGLYCSFVADKLCQRESFNSILQHFDTVDLDSNDQLVLSYYNQHIQSGAFKKPI